MKIEIEFTDDEFDRMFDIFKAVMSQDLDENEEEIGLEIEEPDEEIDEDFASLCECPPLEMDDDPAFSVSDTARLGDKLVLCSLALYRDYGEDRVSFSVRDCDATGEVLYRVQSERCRFASVISENIYAGPALDLFRTLSDFVPECD